MANIKTFLAQIISARYGKDVRQSIHDSIYSINEQVESAETSTLNNANVAAQCATNAKTYMESASTSEANAKKYAEQALQGTPEGYDALVEDVEGLKTNTPSKKARGSMIVVSDSAATPFVDLKIHGYSTQNGTPSADAKQSIHNGGNCVDMIQGAYGTTNGVYGTSSQYICSKNPIPCKSGDVITVSSDMLEKAQAIFYNESGFVSALSLSGVSATTPSGATYFKFNIYNANGITPSTVGKISLTINGKYVVQIVEHGKNLVDFAKVSSLNGGSYTFNENTGELSYTYQGGYAHVSYDISYLVGKTVTRGYESISNTNSSAKTTTQIVVTNADGTKTYIPNPSNYLIPSDAKSVVFNLYGNNSSTSYSGTLTVVKPMLMYADITDGTYEPYKEKVATVLLNEPLRESDVMSRTEVVRKRATVVFDGSATLGTLNIFTNVVRSPIILSTPSKSSPNGICDSLPYLANYTDDSEHFYAQGGTAFLFLNMSRLSSVDSSGIKSYLTSNPITVEYELAEEVIETLDPDSQIALNSLKTFNPVTVITNSANAVMDVEYVNVDHDGVVNMVLNHVGSQATETESDFAYVDVDVSDDTATTYPVVLPNGFTTANTMIAGYMHMTEVAGTIVNSCYAFTDETNVTGQPMIEIADTDSFEITRILTYSGESVTYLGGTVRVFLRKYAVDTSAVALAETVEEVTEETTEEVETTE